MEIRFHIYLASKTRWSHLTKVIDLPAVPRAGETVKFRNRELGDYFGFQVLDVTYHEGGAIEIMTDLLNNIDGRMYSFDDEAEFDDYHQSYLREGWTCGRGIKPNRRFSAATG